MPTREQMIQELQAQDFQQPSREQMIAQLIEQDAQGFQEPQEPTWLEGRVPDYIPLIGGSEIGEDLLRPSLQAIGGAAGGVLGGSMGALAGGIGAIPGAAVGGGTGYAGGEQIYRLLEQIARPETIKSPGEELVQTGQNILEGTAMEAAGMGAGAAIEPLARLAPKLLKGIATGLHKVPGEAVERIVARPQQIMEAATQSPQDAGLKLLEEIVQSKNIKVTEAVEGLNRVLGQASEGGATVNINPVLTELDTALNKVGELQIGKTSKKNLAELKSIISDVESLRRFFGNDIPVTKANDVKRLLQEIAYPVNDQGFKFFRKDPVGNAMKKAAKSIKNSIEDKVPGVTEYNKTLKQILDVETDKKFSSAFRPEQIENTLRNIQSPTGNKGYLQGKIRELDKVLGSNIEDTTLDFFAAKYMQPGDVLSNIPTGRALLAPMLGGAAGGGLGALGAAAVASPATFRAIAPKIGALRPHQQGIEAISKSPQAKQLLRTLGYEAGREER